MMKEWFEKESFWRSFYPYMFPEQRMLSSSEEVEDILSLVGFQPRAVLDLCCGPGRHAVEMAKRGVAVTGVDRTPFLLKKAMLRAKKENVRIEWIKADMRRFVRPESFDLVLNLFTSFGYFDNKDDDRKALGNIFQSLLPRGAFVLEMMGKERLARIFLPTSSTEYADGTLLVERRKIFDDWTRIHNDWILIKNGKATTWKFHHTLYSGQELKDRLYNAGFSRVKLFGDFKGSEYNNDAQRLVAVAFKSKKGRGEAALDHGSQSK